MHKEVNMFLSALNPKYPIQKVAKKFANYIEINKTLILIMFIEINSTYIPHIISKS